MSTLSTLSRSFMTLALAAGIVIGAVGALGAVAHADAEAPAEAAGAPHAEHGDAAKADGHGHGGHGDPSKHFRFFGSPFGHGEKDVAGGPLGDGSNFDPKTGSAAPGEEEPMSAPFIFMVLNFVVLLVLLARYGGPPVRKIAADRHDQIKSALDEAERLRKQAADKLGEYESKLKAADAEIAKLVEDMRAAAEADRDRIRQSAERQAAQMKRDAELRIAAEIETARAQLTREVTAAAAAATEKLLRERMTAADHQQQIGAFIHDLQAARKEAR